MLTTVMPIKRTLMGLLAAVTLAIPANADGLEVRNAYARTAYPGAPSGAAFMVIHNHGGPGDRLIDVQSDVAARVELHTHIDAGDGVMQMRHVPEGFDLPTDGTIVMARGGHHVMFMGLTQTLENGTTVAVTLIFESGSEMILEIEIMSDEDVGHGGMDHGDTDHGDIEHDDMDHDDADHADMDQDS